jgi:hypothetical protein
VWFSRCGEWTFPIGSRNPVNENLVLQRCKLKILDALVDGAPPVVESRKNFFVDPMLDSGRSLLAFVLLVNTKVYPRVESRRHMSG